MLTQEQRASYQEALGSCEVVALRINTVTHLAVTGMTSNAFSGGGHDLVATTFNDGSTMAIVGIGPENSDEKAINNQEGLTEVDRIVACAKTDPPYMQLFLFIDNFTSEMAKEVANRTNRSVLFFENDTLEISRSMTGDTVVRSVNNENVFKSVFPGNEQVFSFSPEVKLVRAAHMNKTNSDYEGFINENTKQLNRNWLGGNQYEFLSPNLGDTDHVKIKNLCCGSQIGKGGHIDITASGKVTKGNRPTIVIMHGYNPDNLNAAPATQVAQLNANQNAIIETVIAKTSHANHEGTGSDQPLVISCSYMTAELATEISGSTQRPVIFAINDVVTNTVHGCGDLILQTVSNQGFFKVDAKTSNQISWITNVIGIPATPEMSQAYKQQHPRALMNPLNTVQAVTA